MHARPGSGLTEAAGIEEALDALAYRETPGVVLAAHAFGAHLSGQALAATKLLELAFPAHRRGAGYSWTGTGETRRRPLPPTLRLRRPPSSSRSSSPTSSARQPLVTRTPSPSPPRRRAATSAASSAWVAISSTATPL